MRYALLIGLGLLAGCGKGDGGDTSKSVAAIPAADRKPVGTTSAGNLYLDFGENQVNANSKYKGKVWSISGQVHSVTESDGGYAIGFLIYLDEATTNPPGVIAKFPAARQDGLGSIKPYDEVTVTGLCVGRAPGDRKGYAVVLEDCTLVSTKKK